MTFYEFTHIGFKLTYVDVVATKEESKWLNLFLVVQDTPWPLDRR